MVEIWKLVHSFRSVEPLGNSSQISCAIALFSQAKLYCYNVVTLPPQVEELYTVMDIVVSHLLEAHQSHLPITVQKLVEL